MTSAEGFKLFRDQSREPVMLIDKRPTCRVAVRTAPISLWSACKVERVSGGRLCKAVGTSPEFTSVSCRLALSMVFVPRFLDQPSVIAFMVCSMVLTLLGLVWANWLPIVKVPSFVGRVNELVTPRRLGKLVVVRPGLAGETKLVPVSK